MQVLIITCFSLYDNEFHFKISSKVLKQPTQTSFSSKQHCLTQGDSIFEGFSLFMFKSIKKAPFGALIIKLNCYLYVSLHLLLESSIKQEPGSV